MVLSRKTNRYSFIVSTMSIVIMAAVASLILVSFNNRKADADLSRTSKTNSALIVSSKEYASWLNNYIVFGMAENIEANPSIAIDDSKTCPTSSSFWRRAHTRAIYELSSKSSLLANATVRVSMIVSKSSSDIYRYEGVVDVLSSDGVPLSSDEQTLYINPTVNGYAVGDVEGDLKFNAYCSKTDMFSLNI